MNIRPETPEDIPSIYQINSLAFGRPEEANLVDALRACGAAVLSLVAEEKGQVVGHALFSPVRVETGAEEAHGLGLGPVAVLPVHQRRGIGTALMEAGLAACREAGHPFVILVGHATYYPRFGFEPASRYGLRLPFEVSEEAFMVIALQPGALEGVQGIAHYHPAFDDVE